MMTMMFGTKNDVGSEDSMDSSHVSSTLPLCSRATVKTISTSRPTWFQMFRCSIESHSAEAASTLQRYTLKKRLGWVEGSFNLIGHMLGSESDVLQ